MSDDVPDTTKSWAQRHVVVRANVQNRISHRTIELRDLIRLVEEAKRVGLDPGTEVGFAHPEKALFEHDLGDKVFRAGVIRLEGITKETES